MGRTWIVALLVAACVGCETKPTPTAPSARETKPPPAPEPQPPQFAPPPDPAARPPRDQASDEKRKPAEVEMVRVPARAGVTGKGQYDPTIVGTPLTAHFSLKEQLMFDVAIPKALELFEQTRNRKVASQQEFMTEIIGKSNLRLPPLPPQYRYVYDPQRGELMVEMPRGAN